MKFAMLKRYLVTFTILTVLISFLGLLSCKKVVLNGKVHQYQNNPLVVNGKPFGKDLGVKTGIKIYDYVVLMLSPKAIKAEPESKNIISETKPTLLLETKPTFSKTESKPESVPTESKKMVESLPETKPASGW